MDAAGVFELITVAQDAMQGCKKLLCGELFFIVVFRYLHHKENAVYIEDLEAINFAVITGGQNNQDDNDWNPNYGHHKKVKNFHASILA